MPFWVKCLVVLLLLFVQTAREAFADFDCRDGVVQSWSGEAAQIGACIEYFFDPTSAITAGEIVSTQGSQFRQSTSRAPNLGFAHGTYWMRVRVDSELVRKSGAFLSLGNPLIDRAMFYEKEGGRLRELGRSGVVVAGSEESVSDRDMTFRLSAGSGRVSEFFVSAQGVQQSFVPTLRSEVEFNHHQRLEYLVFGLYFGVIAVMALYNLSLFFVVRETVYLWYVCAIVFFHGFCFAGLMGATNFFLWPEATTFAQRQLPASAPLGLLFTVLFAYQFLQIEQNHPRVAKLLRALCVVLVVHFSMSIFLFNIWHITIGFAFQVAALVLVMSSAIPQARKGVRSARLFLLAWVSIIVAGLVFCAGQFGLLNHTFLSLNGPLLGSAVEVVLLSLALGDKINTIRLEKEAAQQIALENARERAVLDAEMSAAVAVQSTLLPPSMNSVGYELSTYYRVAERVGGDWFWHSQDERTGLVYVYIGDVTGHGVPSALLTGVICGAVASLESEFAKSSTDVDPEERLLTTARNINEVVWKTGARSNRQVSMCLLCFDPETGEVVSVNAGHPFPLIWHAQDMRLDSIVSSGPLMGNATGDFSVHRDILTHGDYLMLFTDGLFEARERLKTEKSSSRRREMTMIFKQCNSASDVTDRITQQLSVFTDNENSLTDDVSVIVLRRRESPDEKSGQILGGAAA
ncbi:MAG: hypothetical protein RLZZ488_2408 [Pseudomonadota bacterium]|jgi:serine phosphatase RsbU (regulator of sigma subunit)